MKSSLKQESGTIKKGKTVLNMEISFTIGYLTFNFTLLCSYTPRTVINL